jgi:hypothetical protein
MNAFGAEGCTKEASAQKESTGTQQDSVLALQLDPQEQLRAIPS